MNLYRNIVESAGNKNKDVKKKQGKKYKYVIRTCEYIILE